MRVRHKPWAKDELTKHPEIVVADPNDHQGKWHQTFNNSNPIHLEVGTGKGKFITDMATAHPNINFVGIEMHDSVIVSVLEKCLALSLVNVKLLNVDATELTDYFGENEIGEIYLNFSDPWPKNRHEKRRLTSHLFLQKYKKVLIGGGRLNLKTDNQGLFEFSLESFSRDRLTLENVSLDLHRSGTEGNVMTEYEEKFSNEGKRIYRCETTF